MSPRDPRILLAPDSDEEPIPVSPRKLADLLRRLEKLEAENRRLQELEAENQRLRRENERLRPALDKAREKNARLTDKADGLSEKLEGLRNSLSVLGTDAKTAAAVGVPSSRVFFRQPPPSPEERRSPGGQPGHPGTTRPRPVPNAPPRVLSLENCPDCATRLGEPCDSSSHPITDLPESHLDIFELKVNRYKCPGCGKRVHATVPEGYRGEFGPRLKAFVVNLRIQGLSFEKIAEFLASVYGLEVSVASLLAMEEGVAESLDETYTELREEMTDAARTPHAQGDETSMPVNGVTEWVWVGTSSSATVYWIRPGRGGVEADAMWAGYRGALTHDGLDSYNSVRGATHQMDLVHVNRWLQKVEAKYSIEPRGLLSKRGPKFRRAGHPPTEFLEFAAGIRRRLAAEVRWVERHPKAPPGGRSHRYEKAVGSMRRFLNRSWRDEDVVRIVGELRQRLDRLFTFVRMPGVSWNSNEAEREVRVPVVIRKMSGGRRTARGTWVLERLLTVSRTWRKRKLSFWNFVVQKLGMAQAPGPPSAGPAS